MARRASTIPRALHSDRIVVAQPGRTLVRLPHPATPTAQRPQKRCGPGERRPQLGRPMEHQPTPVRLAQHRRRNPQLPRPISTMDFRRRTPARVSSSDLVFCCLSGGYGPAGSKRSGRSAGPGRRVSMLWPDMPPSGGGTEARDEHASLSASATIQISGIPGTQCPATIR